MDDVYTSPYAQWLEDMCKSVMEMKPAKIGICMLAEDGTVLTGYFGDICPQDKAVFALHFNTDSVMDVVMANAKSIVEAAEEEGDEEDEDG